MWKLKKSKGTIKLIKCKGGISMSVDAVSQLMQQNALQSLYGANSGSDSGNNNIDFSTLLGDVMQTSANKNTDSTVNQAAKAGNDSSSSQSDSLDELEKMFQLQSLQDMSNAYNAADSLGNIDDSSDDSSSDSSLGLSGSDDYQNEMMDSILQLLSQDQNQTSSSTTDGNQIANAASIGNLM